MSRHASLQGVILYLDASALVKRYIAEPGSSEVAEAIAEVDAVGTSPISRAEIAAALSKAVRMGTLTDEGAMSALQVFRSEWSNLVRVQATEMLIARADTLARELGLRGYDVVHLTSALLWQEGLEQPVGRNYWDVPAFHEVCADLSPTKWTRKDRNRVSCHLGVPTARYSHEAWFLFLIRGVLCLRHTHPGLGFPLAYVPDLS